MHYSDFCCRFLGIIALRDLKVIQQELPAGPMCFKHPRMFRRPLWLVVLGGERWERAPGPLLSNSYQQPKANKICEIMQTRGTAADSQHLCGVSQWCTALLPAPSPMTASTPRICWPSGIRHPPIFMTVSNSMCFSGC